MAKSTLGAVFIDVGYTLVYDSPSFVETCAELIRSEDIDPDVTRMLAFVAENAETLDRNIRRPGLYAEDLRIRDLWASYFGDLIMAGAPSLRDMAQDLGGAVYDAYNPGTRWVTFPDVLEALTILNDVGFHLHVVSDWDSTLPEILKAIDLDRFFRAFHISAHLRLAKSGPEIYTMALQRSGLAASEVIMIGDSCTRDVEIPSAIGITALYIDRNHLGNCNPAVATFPDLKHAALYILEQYVPKGYPKQD